jgi:UDP-N-acetyl-D-mannosaminuronic acid dehydrogenase
MHTPGAGVGGHCLPKDSWLLKYGLDAYGSFKFEPDLITGSRYLNDNMPAHMKELIEEALKEKSLRLRDAKLTLLGVAFLENSDDTRNTPAEPLYQLLEGQCKDIIAHDPYVKEYETMKITQNLSKAVNDSDCLIVVTRHKEYLSIKPATLKKQMNTPIIVDGRNIFSQEECLKLGFSFRGVGLPKKASG